MTDQHGGSLLLGLGAYNGWQKGMTREDVRTKAREWGCFARMFIPHSHLPVSLAPSLPVADSRPPHFWL